MSVVALVAGIGSGIVIGRSTAPAPPSPQIEQSRQSVEPAREEPPKSAPQDTPILSDQPVAKQEPPPLRRQRETKRQTESSGPQRDVALADERALIEIARTALAKRDTAKAINALEGHSQRFPAGQLSEERESLWVQALVNAGDVVGAQQRADEFKRHYPNSMLQPAVDAALNSAR